MSTRNPGGAEIWWGHQNCLEQSQGTAGHGMDTWGTTKSTTPHLKPSHWEGGFGNRAKQPLLNSSKLHLRMNNHPLNKNQKITKRGWQQILTANPARSKAKCLFRNHISLSLGSKVWEWRGHHMSQHIWAHFSVDLGSPYTHMHTHRERERTPPSFPAEREARKNPSCCSAWEIKASVLAM